MSEPINADLVTIPRWTIQREPLAPDCPRCGSSVVRVRADDRHQFFCSCQILADLYVPRHRSR
jgi:hypothetical protein